MKVYNDNEQIVSLENIRNISKISEFTLRAIYNDGKEAILRFNSAKETHEAMEKITLILQTEAEETPILFENLCFRKSDLVYTRLLINRIQFVFGGHGGHLVEESIAYSSEKSAKTRYQELLEKLK